MSVRLEWDGKPTQVERVSLPFQTVETINESRATRQRDEGSLLGAGEQDQTWRNQLIWGDNKLVMSSLLKEFAGQIKLIYIDPPFATGDDFSVSVRVGDLDTDILKEPSILEEYAYRDTWGRGVDSYLSMIYERLTLLRELLADDGTIYVHLDWRMCHYVKLMLDEIFGSSNFMNNVVWCYSTRQFSKRMWNRKHHDLLVYSKNPDRQVFNWDVEGVLEPYSEATVKKYKHQDEVGYYRLSGRGITGSPIRSAKDVDPEWEITHPHLVVREYLGKGFAPHDYWKIDIVNQSAHERTEYKTQKPERLLERAIKASSNEGDLVADFFVGSGTTAAVAEKLGRRWIACDLGRFAIHTTRKRLLNIPDCRPFEIKNLGAYERQRWRQDTGNGALRGYLDTILAFYRAEPVEGFQHLHGRKAGRMVHVGATDAPVTIDEAEEVMDELADNGIESCDLLGWEWEMGLHDTIGERARRRGLDLRPLQIPREVMERQVQDADAIRFFELAHLDLDVRRQGLEAKVVLKDFAIPSEDLIPTAVRERITRYADLIDYWSIDFDHRDGVFHNQWQAYRTRAEPALATESGWHEYPAAGRYAIVVKVIDIFGNDTTKLAEVTIK
ncbi:MAG: site-specific DNA-methyltransferase [Gaiellaceae bacterium MAG52_C11]|nr:site-specific DNA-methyltransferase [Candidatus Gaiellasilicea maunaloa]